MLYTRVKRNGGRDMVAILLASQNVFLGQKETKWHIWWIRLFHFRKFILFTLIQNSSTSPGGGGGGESGLGGWSTGGSPAGNAGFKWPWVKWVGGEPGGGGGGGRMSNSGSKSSPGIRRFIRLRFTFFLIFTFCGSIGPGGGDLGGGKSSPSDDEVPSPGLILSAKTTFFRLLAASSRSRNRGIIKIPFPGSFNSTGGGSGRLLFGRFMLHFTSWPGGGVSSLKNKYQMGIYF